MVRSKFLAPQNAPAPQEGQDLRVMLEAQADYLPIHAVVAGTQGDISCEMLDAVVLFLNHERMRGIVAFVRAYIAGKKASV
jgi:hypothetical protein